MTANKTAFALLTAALAGIAATSGQAADGTADHLEADYPEGPLIVRDSVYFAEMHRDRIVIWEGTQNRVFYRRKGCGPTALAPYAEGFAILCHLTNEIHIVDDHGRPLRRIKHDVQHRPFLNPNDASADDAGGVYFSASGRFSRGAAKEGALFYLDAAGDVYRLVSDLHYANGVHFDAARQTLFATEHLAGRVLSYPVAAPGRVGEPAVFADFTGDPILQGSGLVGPDGLETDNAGNLYAAFYGAGKVLVLTPDGDVMHCIEAPEPLITNLALTKDARALYVTGANRARRKPYPGAIRKLQNPAFSD